MEDKISRDKNKIKVFSSLLIIVLLVMGVSFAIFQNFARQSGTNNLGATSCFSVTFEGVNNAINLANDYPIPDSEGLERNPYTFKVTNNCNQYLSLSIGVETLSTSEIPSNLIKGVIVKNDETPTSAFILSSGKTMEAQNGGTAYELLSEGLGAKVSKTYANSYSSLVGKYLPNNSLSNAGSNTAGTMKTTTNLSGVYYVVSATSSSFTYKRITSNKNTTEALLASTEDDYGTSYYFRGAVKNNYVEFANKCWRIVRITGNGSVKLVLHNDNTAGTANPCASSNNSDEVAFAHYDGSTYTSEFNINYKDNAYVGFMYGTVGASDYASTHANINKSTILKNLETWYTNNLASYESILADTIWCNDKSTVSGGLGYGTNETDYAAYNRLVSTKQPTLICPKDNNGRKLSKFTVDDTTNGNGNLTYKIGLLTADEIAFAGSVSGYYNCSTYLQENTGKNFWWSLSPYFFRGSTVQVWIVYLGYLSNSRVSSGYGLRPVISLISSTNVTGDGTSENPYKVV